MRERKTDTMLEKSPPQIVQAIRPSFAIAGVLLLAIGLLFACISPLLRPLEAQDTDPAWSSDSKHIVFICYRRERAKVDWDDPYNGPYTTPSGFSLQEICTIDIDTQQREQLTDNHVPEFDPVWSPDGTQIVFSSGLDESSGMNLFVMNADGTGVTQLTHDGGGYNKPEWSPDGQSIAFIRGFLGGDLYVMNKDGSKVTQLTSDEGVTSFSWSPDGEAITFAGGKGVGSNLYIMDFRTQSRIQLTYDQEFVDQPIWSPDGNHILFYAGHKLAIADVQALEVANLQTSNGVRSTGDWSSDSQSIAFILVNTHPNTLHILDVVSGEEQVFKDFQGVGTPLWSPDDQYLLYIQPEDRNHDGFSEDKLWILRLSDSKEWTLSD
jgi:Tol biopolymer transport system component